MFNLCLLLHSLPVATRRQPYLPLPPPCLRPACLPACPAGDTTGVTTGGEGMETGGGTTGAGGGTTGRTERVKIKR